VAAWAGTLAERLRAEAAKEGAGAGLRVLGPAPAPIPRLRERFRHHLQVHGPYGPALRALVGRATAGLKTPDGIAWIVDVDPVEML
jgi:primosomal protein N' (replication factor Y)